LLIKCVSNIIQNVFLITIIRLSKHITGALISRLSDLQVGQLPFVNGSGAGQHWVTVSQTASALIGYHIDLRTGWY